MKHYVYLHRRADDGRVFYIGKGTGRRAWHTQNRNRWWQAVAAKTEHTVEVLARWPTEAEAYAHEEFLIACFRDLGFVLCNLATGGRGSTSGVKKSQEERDQMRRRATGRACTPETRAKISAAKRGVPRGPHSAETKKKISAAQQGKTRGPLTAEHKAALSRLTAEQLRLAPRPRLAGRFVQRTLV